MTKKDYELIAKAVNFETRSKVQKNVRVNVIARLGISLQKDNPQFDYDKFVVACGI